MKAMKLVMIIFMSTGILTGCSFASDAEQEDSLTYEELIILKEAKSSEPLDLGNLAIEVDTIDLVSIEVEKIEVESLFPSNH